MSEKMIFCLGEGKYESKGSGFQKNYRIFNKEVSKEVFDKYYNSQPLFKLPISSWVNEKDMTDEEKNNKPIYKQIGGYLKTLSYKDAWKEGWKNASQEFKNWVINLPNFDEKIFTEIMGIEKVKSQSLKGKKVKVELDGVSYEAIIN
jgi:hypothetical protein